MTLTSSSAAGNVWSTGSTTQSITVSTSGTYSVTVTNGNGCSATSAGTTVTVNPDPATPTITAGGPLTFCAGGSVTLTSSSATGNVWSTGATTQSITANASGNYSVTVTDGNGCSATSAGTTVTVNPNPATPTISADGPLAFCTGGSVTLTSSSATGNTWSTGSTTPSIVVNTGGSYSVIVTDANGCSAASAVQSVVVNTSPVVVLEYAATSFCADGSTILPTIAVPFTPGAYFTAPTALSIDPNTGAITLLNTIVPNTYNIGLVSAGPCASSDWFELTIQNTSNNTTTISACDTYTWARTEPPTPRAAPTRV
ncbi:MAG: hypothetical protein IPO05_04525 [Flavobacteriales bacterium]|nr:hypothetical protein [Flavobacteriales bacterium]